MRSAIKFVRTSENQSDNIESNNTHDQTGSNHK